MKLTKPALFVLFVCVCAVSAHAQRIVIKIGCLAPANSPWDQGLKRLAADWAKISNGKVQLIFPKSVANISNEDMVQKLKLSLDGAILDTSGLALLDEDINFLSMPSVIRSDAEYETVMKAAIPLLQKKLAARYELVAMGKGGWIYFFSNQRLIMPDDLKKIRVGVSRTNEYINKLIQSMGIRTARVDLSSQLLQFNSGVLDATYSSPIYLAALWSQYKQVITHMCPVKLTIFFGGIVINRKTWDAIPDDIKPALRAAAENVCREIGDEAVKLDTEAIAAMKRGGLTVPMYTQENESAWQALYEEKLRSTIIHWFSPQFTSAIMKATGR